MIKCYCLLYIEMYIIQDVFYCFYNEIPWWILGVSRNMLLPH